MRPIPHTHRELLVVFMRSTSSSMTHRMTAKKVCLELIPFPLGVDCWEIVVMSNPLHITILRPTIGLSQVTCHLLLLLLPAVPCSLFLVQPFQRFISACQFKGLGTYTGAL